ncbi:MAG: nitroreductase family protein [Candidatus Aminicenantales bacterium]
MNIHEVIAARRSIRQFQGKPVAREILTKILDAGRLAPSAANLQPLEFLAVDDPAARAEVFSCL